MWVLRATSFLLMHTSLNALEVSYGPSNISELFKTSYVLWIKHPSFSLVCFFFFKSASCLPQLLSSPEPTVMWDNCNWVFEQRPQGKGHSLWRSSGSSWIKVKLNKGDLWERSFCCQVKCWKLFAMGFSASPNPFHPANGCQVVGFLYYHDWYSKLPHSWESWEELKQINITKFTFLAKSDIFPWIYTSRTNISFWLRLRVLNFCFWQCLPVFSWLFMEELVFKVLILSL